MGFGKSYSGPAKNFPAKSTWKTFDEIFNANKHEMLQTGDMNADVNDIYNAVKEASKKIGVEERVIFSLIMQESTGNVGVQSTLNGGPADAGLMQCEGSPGFPGKHGIGQENITKMIEAGTKHFKANLEQVGNQDTAECIYEAARLYNSGSIDKNNLSDAKGATASYVSDIANRLQGHTN